jgi:hypothetical protein
MGRSTWVAAGVALGVAGTLWAEQRVRRGVAQVTDRITPEHLAADATGAARRAGRRLQDAVAAGRDTRLRREAELRAAYGPPARTPDGAPRPSASAVVPTPHGARGRRTARRGDPGHR